MSGIQDADGLRSQLESHLAAEQGHDSRKASGSYYTPYYIIDYIVTRTLAPILDSAGRESVRLRDPIESYLAIRVIDIAAGSGRFLSRAAREIARSMIDATGLGFAEAFRLVLENCIFGTDADADALEIAAITLTADAGGEGNIMHLKVCDALLSTPPGVTTKQQTLEFPSPSWVAISESPPTCRDHGFDWTSEFPDVFSRIPGGFDAVIGNPPWLSFSGRQSTKLDKDMRQYLYTHWPSIRGWPSAHGIFLHLAAKLCREGGRIGQIVPEQILDLNRYSKARAALFRETKLAEPPLSVGERAFRGVIGPSCVIILEKLNLPAGSANFEPIRAEGILTPTEVRQFDSSEDELARAVINKMKRFPHLPHEAFADPGVHTGNSADLLLRKTSEPCLEPLLVGRDVTRYFAGTPRLWLNIPTSCPDGRYYRIARPERYSNAVILIRQTATHPIAARNPGSCYFRNSLLACYGCGGYSVEYLLAILNSSLVRFFHQYEYRDGRQATFPQVKVGHLRSIPIPPPTINENLANELISLVKQMEELSSVELTSNDKAIDEIVCKLYGLTSSETRFILASLQPHKPHKPHQHHKPQS